MGRLDSGFADGDEGQQRQWENLRTPVLRSGDWPGRKELLQHVSASDNVHHERGPRGVSPETGADQATENASSAPAQMDRGANALTASGGIRLAHQDE